MISCLGHEGLIFERITAFEHPLMKKLKQINSILFPQHYNDFFYIKLLKSVQVYFYLIFLGDELIGTCGFIISNANAISGNDFFPREFSHAGETTCCYIMTLGVLSVYRRMGYGKAIWQFIYNHVMSDNFNQSLQFYLHVQVSNELALRFYESLGFKIIGDRIPNYYKRIAESDALVMWREKRI